MPFSSQKDEKNEQKEEKQLPQTFSHGLGGFVKQWNYFESQ